jgi:hypothetical protein
LPLSTAAILEYLTGYIVPADSVRDWCYGENDTGYTFPADMAQYLSNAWGIPSEVIVIDAPQDVIADALDKDWPVLARTWEEGRYFHWTPITEFGSEWVTRHQPLGGYQENIARGEWLRRYAGYVLIVQQAKA